VADAAELVLPPAVIVIEVGLVLIVGMTIITDKIIPTIDIHDL
jgi:hypothetical protein